MTQYLLKNELNLFQTIANIMGLSLGFSTENFVQSLEISSLCLYAVCTRAILYNEVSCWDNVVGTNHRPFLLFFFLIITFKLKLI